MALLNVMKDARNTRKHYDEKTTKKRLYLAMVLTFICTLFTTSGTYLWKIGSANITSIESFILNPFVIGGFVFYGLGSVILIFALSKGDLSVLYPIISTGFIWTFLISYIIFREPVYVTKIVGILLIASGIIFLGFGADKK